jgi:hypothetical protein
MLALACNSLARELAGAAQPRRRLGRASTLNRRAVALGPG